MTEKERSLSLLVHGKDSPIFVQTGYGKLLQYVSPLLQDANWITRLHCPVGQPYGEAVWREPRSGKEIIVWGGGEGTYGENIVPAHMARLKEQSGGKDPMLLFIGDLVGLDRIIQWNKSDRLLSAAWCAVDWESPTPDWMLDKTNSFYRAWSMSRFGHEVLKQDGAKNLLDPVWLGVNPDVFKPMDKSQFPDLFESMGYSDDGFNVFSCFANQHMRKSEYEMLSAIGEFHKWHPEAKIHFYGLTQVRRDWDFAATTKHLGLEGLVSWSDDYAQHMQEYTEEEVAAMINCADACLSLGYEGFGLHTIEAQSCAKPVIGFGAAATTELIKGGAGLLVPPERDFMHQNNIRRLFINKEMLVTALEKAYDLRKDRQRWDKGRRFVLQNATWRHTGEALVKNLEAIEQSVADEELLGPLPPGPHAKELAEQQVVLE